MRLTKEQQIALKRVWARAPEDETYVSMRRRCKPAFGGECIMLEWCGMWLGIERDGYTHS